MFLSRFVALYIISYIKQQFSIKTMKNKIRDCVIGMYCIHFARDSLYAQIKCQDHVGFTSEAGAVVSETAQCQWFLYVLAVSAIDTCCMHRWHEV